VVEVLEVNLAEWQASILWEEHIGLILGYSWENKVELEQTVLVVYNRDRP